VKRLLLITLLAAGCASYGESKIELAEQARRGVKLAREATERREQQLAAFDARQRTALDEAFDADVLHRAGLTADWVVAHRRAYAVALDALRGRRLEAERAKQKALENLDAVDRALVQLQQMQQAELKLALPEVKP
jgi:hypothetical protein